MKENGNGSQKINLIVRAFLLALIVCVNAGFASWWILKPSHETREVLKWSVILSVIFFGGLITN